MVKLYKQQHHKVYQNKNKKYAHNMNLRWKWSCYNQEKAEKDYNSKIILRSFGSTVFAE